MRSLAELLTEWLPRQRWFAAKGVDLERIDIASRSRLADDLGGATIDHVLVEVVSPLGTQYYQLFLALHATAGGDQHWVIGDVEGGSASDALHDPAVTAALIRGLAAGETWGDIRLIPEADASIDTSSPGRVLTGEQSNTSVIYAGARSGGILKVYRRLEPGVNPDVEIHRALHHAGNAHVAQPLAVLEGDVGGEPTTLGLLSDFLAGAQDGWELATASVRRAIGVETEGPDADFAGEALALGTTVAEVHRDLVAEFGAIALSDDAWGDVVDGMVAEATRVAGYVPSVAALLPGITATFDRARSLSAPVIVQRVHGDLHLGQTLRTPAGWAVIDFEGEPAKSVVERKERYLAAKDIAGMLRSFDYAANHLRPAGSSTPEQVAAAENWAAQSRAAFLDGYRTALGDGTLSPPEVIAAFELDKAVYEVAYEFANRPSWEPIPLHAVQTLIEIATPSEADSD